MTHTFRKKIFWVFIITFVIIGAGLVYYMQGYRIDFSSWKLQKTGAVYIESNLSNIEIFLNEKSYKDKSSFIQKGTLITNILPKRYRLTLKKDGYFDYEKNIEVISSPVTRILNVVFVPKKIEITTQDTKIKGTEIIDTRANKIITRDPVQNIYYFNNLTEPVSSSNLTSKISSFFRQKILGIKFYTNEENRYVVKTAKGLYSIDIEKESVDSIIAGTVSYYEIKNNDLYYVIEPVVKTPSKTSTTKLSITPSSTVDVFDLTLSRKASSIITPFNPLDVKKIDISSKYSSYLLDNGGLYIKRGSGTDFVQIAHSAKQSSISPDDNKILYQDFDGKMFIYLFEDDIVNFDLVKDSVLKLNIPDASRIKNFTWYKDSYHIFVEYPQKISLAEITKMEPNNVFLISDIGTENVFLGELEKWIDINNGKITTINTGW